MSTSHWTPPDISQVCLEQAAPLTQCSQTGLLYLTLLTQLYNSTVERNYYQKNEYCTTSSDSAQDLHIELDSMQNGTEADNTAEHNRRNKEEMEEYDFIIVGAGSAGCVLANRLSEIRKWKILLLEAGSEEPDITSVPSLASVLPGSNIDWGYHTQPEDLSCQALKDRACVWPRGKTMGGSSAINYLVYMRGNKADYDGWAEAGNPGWSYREVLPYFKKAENNQDVSLDKEYHSIGGPLNVEYFPYMDINEQMLVQAFTEKELPITDFNGKNQYGTNIAQSTSLRGQRISINSAYLQPIRNVRPNLKIITQAYVTKIIIDSNTKTAIGVEYLRQDKKFTAYATKEVISSAGSINSPKLLMLSGVGPEDHLTNLNITVFSNLKVGHNLQDHVTTEALVVTLSNETSTSVDRQQLLDSITNYYNQPPSKHGPLASTSMFNAVAFIKTEFAENNVPDIQIQCDVRHVQDFYSDPQTYLATNIFPFSFYNALAPKPLLLVPKSRGCILLNETDPVFGPPLIYPRFFTENVDLASLISAMKFVVALEETDAFKQSGAVFLKSPLPGCECFVWGSDEYFKCILIKYTTTASHPAGTCKMGPVDDLEAVVDAELRVYGIKKLRVVDASIMPSIVRGNLNAPVVMIAEKIADSIKRVYNLNS